MARILFLPVFLAILALVVFLIIRVKSMFGLSKSKDITLYRPTPYQDDPEGLIRGMLEALKALENLEFKSEIITNFRKITTYSRIGTSGRYSKITGKSSFIEVTGDNGSVSIKGGKPHLQSIPGQNPWVYFWCGISTLEESLRLFYEGGMKVQAGNTGTYMERKYTEILVLSHAMPQQSNEAFELCIEPMAPVYGKSMIVPGIKIRNFMGRILVNNLTSMPDYIEIKYNVFKDDHFIGDCLQNYILLY